MNLVNDFIQIYILHREPKCSEGMSAVFFLNIHYTQVLHIYQRVKLKYT